MNFAELTDFRTKQKIVINPTAIVSMQEAVSQKEYEATPTYYTIISCVNGKEFSVFGKLQDVMNVILFPSEPVRIPTDYSMSTNIL